MEKTKLKIEDVVEFKSDVSDKYTFFEELKFNLRYYLIEKPKEFWYNLKYFFGNIKRFRKQLWKYRTYDFCFNLKLFAESIEWLAHDIENGYEETRSANKKVKAIRELKSLIEYMCNDSEYDTFEVDDDFNVIHVGGWETIEERQEVYDKNKKKTFDRIYQILYGQDRKSRLSKDGESWYEDWVEWFDGTGYESWWN